MLAMMRMKAFLVTTTEGLGGEGSGGATSEAGGVGEADELLSKLFSSWVLPSSWWVSSEGMGETYH
jgi:hypothetical protein